MSLVIHCADIGSVKNGNFGWVRLSADDANDQCVIGTDISEFADLIAADINAGHRVAIGFECPLFVPLPDDPMALTSARPGEGDRAWSAGGGCGALATGLTETTWILERVMQKLSAPCAVHFSWDDFQLCGGLFVWEAFVTKEARTNTHTGDAKQAALSFLDSLPDPNKHNAVICDGRVRSLIGAALLQAGWGSDLSWLHRSCLVIRARPRTD